MKIQSLIKALQFISDNEDKIEDWEIYPVNKTYPNGTYQSCQKVVIGLEFYRDKISPEKLKELGFRVVLDKNPDYSCEAYFNII